MAIIVAGLIIAYVSFQRQTISLSAAGKYIHENNPSNFVEFFDNGTFHTRENLIDYYGTWTIEGEAISFHATVPMSSYSSGTIHGNTLVDPEGKKWIKQGN